MSWPGWRAVATSSPLPFPCKPRDCARFEPTGLRTACPRSHDRTTGAPSAVGLVVRSEDASRDTAAVADLVTALARPLPDCAQVAATLTRSGPCPARVLAAPGTTSMANPGTKVVAQLLGVGCSQVDLIRKSTRLNSSHANISY